MKTSLSGYGLDYESPIRKARAKELLGNIPIPRMGYETDLIVKPDPFWCDFKVRLVIQNISGSLILACVNIDKCQWVDVFGVKP